MKLLLRISFFAVITFYNNALIAHTEPAVTLHAPRANISQVSYMHETSKIGLIIRSKSASVSVNQYVWVFNDAEVKLKVSGNSKNIYTAKTAIIDHQIKVVRLIDVDQSERDVVIDLAQNMVLNF